MATLHSLGALRSFKSQICLSRRDTWTSSAPVCGPSATTVAGGFHTSLILSSRTDGYPQRRYSASRIASVAAVEDVELVTEDVSEEHSSLAPTSFEVQNLLMEICDETSIAELQLKIGSFRLNVKRDVGKIKGASTVANASPPPVPTKPMVDSLPSSPAPKPANATSATSILTSIGKPVSSIFGFLETAADEGLVFVTSPKVGYFRKGRVAKGKSSPPMVEEGQIIKEGHVVCYLEQLGTQQPVESEIAGEVVKILWKDGEPVGYGDPLIAVRPAFPGIKKLT